jgi:acetylglutamate kinase
MNPTTMPQTSQTPSLEGKRFLVKYGGAAMEKPEVREAVCAEVAQLAKQGVKLIVVHGGGKEISRLIESLGLQTTFIEGVRVTDAEGMRATEMVLSGAVNKDLVSRITRNGTPAVGISGRDAHMIEAKPLVGKNGEDFGLTGEVVRVDPSVVEALLNAGFVPVISPVGETASGDPLNLNADYAAAAIAGALGTETCVFLTDVPGVKKDGLVLPKLTPEDINQLIDDGTISGGMIPKVECAIRAIDAGCPEAIVCDAGRPNIIASALESEACAGTSIRRYFSTAM